ncbi:MAG: LacI family DNA-binding transcriptional regulator [Chloroflexi bacterium]|nr:LacI family DNA-binding transcriptional regulator [Chloroflexota bacterium]
MTKRPQSLEDIASKAAVSRSTVSRIINNAPGVKEKTRQRVLAVIAQEGFVPNPAARALVTRRTHAIGVVIPLAPLTFFEDTFYFPTLLQGISRMTTEHDHAMMLWLVQSEEEHQTFYRRIVTSRLMDGVIIASAASDEPLIDYFLNSGVPFVMVERPGSHIDQISFVSIDNETSACNAVSHLITLGRRRIGHITGNLGIADGVDRVRGYERALATAGLPVDQALIVEGNFSHSAGYLGTRQLVEQHVDAIFAANDITARGVLQALHETHIRVPDDIALIGFDDLPTASQLSPRLTTVCHPVQEKGQMAASILLDLIEDPGSGPHQVMLPTQLIVRESCGAVVL